jgi:hypothetical protein
MGKMSRQRPEQALQISVAAFLRHALKPPTIWTAFPAGGGGRVRGAFLKAMGLQAGWPDLLVMYHRPTLNGFHAPLVVGLELKAGKGKQTPEQKAVESTLNYLGAYYFIARSVDEVEGFLKGVGIPLHAALSPRVPPSDERHTGDAR